MLVGCFCVFSFAYLALLSNGGFRYYEGFIPSNHFFVCIRATLSTLIPSSSVLGWKRRGIFSSSRKHIAFYDSFRWDDEGRELGNYQDSKIR